MVDPQSGGAVLDPSAQPKMGRYLLLQRIGEGGMGVVYAAFDPQLGRRVALKILRSDLHAGSGGQARLMREAQAMARLRHPNVVAVHDVGAVGSQVFLVMEYVAGENLEDWLLRERRPWREVVRVFGEAGRGLATAHRAGLVHRDFKPGNVLLGADGIVRVTDFGLAVAAEASSPATGPAPDSGPHSLSSRLTLAGTVMGTPGYIPPEQHLGAPADPRGDQFSFCVALYEALYRTKPFGGSTPTETALAEARGERQPPPEGSGVPPWVWPILSRGLSPLPEERWPSMEALLAALGNDPAGLRRRRLLQGAAALLVLAIAGGLAWSARQRSQLCTGAERKLAGIWDRARHEAVRQAFAATHLPFADAEWASLEKGLDRWAAEWVAGHTDACEATRLRGEQSEETLTLRMECLDRRLAEGRALAALLEAPDAKLVERAAETVSALSSPVDCGDVARLRAGRRPPPPEQEAVAAAVRDGIARAKVLSGAARYKDMQALTGKNLEAARTLGESPLLAEALGQDGWIAERMGDSRAAEKRLRECFLLAVSLGSDDLGAKCVAQLGLSIGNDHARTEESLGWFDIGDAVAHRLGDRPEDRYRLLGGRALTEETAGRHRAAVAHLLEAIEQNRLAGDRARPDRAALLGGLGGSLLSLGEHDRASRAYRESIALREELGGKEHPSLIASRIGLVAALVDHDEPAEALKITATLIPATDAVYGPKHRWSLYARKVAGQALLDLDRLDEAETRLKEVIEYSDPAHPTFLLAADTALLARVRGKQKRWKEGVALADRALALAESIPGGVGSLRPYYLLARADLLSGAGRAREAVAAAEEAVRLVSVDSEERGPLEHAAALDTLGEALWEEGKDRARARKLVEAALAEYVANRPGSPPTVQLTRWLAEHPGGRK